MTLPSSGYHAVSLNRYLFGYTGAVVRAKGNVSPFTEADFSLSSGSLVLTSDGTTSLASWLTSVGSTIASSPAWYTHTGALTATQVTAANQPILKTDGSGVFKNYLDFSGSNLQFDTNSALDLDVGWTQIAVFKLNSVAALNPLFGSSATRQIAFGANASGVWQGNAAANVNTGGTADTSTHYAVFTGDALGTNNVSMRVDGSSVLTLSNTTSGAAPTSQTLGRSNTSGSPRMNGRFYEYIAYSSKLNGTDLGTLESDIAAFYFPGPGGSAIKTVNGLAVASLKTINGLALASVKTKNGLT